MCVEGEAMLVCGGHSGIRTVGIGDEGNGMSVGVGGVNMCSS